MCYLKEECLSWSSSLKLCCQGVYFVDFCHCTYAHVGWKFAGLQPVKKGENVGTSFDWLLNFVFQQLLKRAVWLAT